MGGWMQAAPQESIDAAARQQEPRSDTLGGRRVLLLGCIRLAITELLQGMLAPKEAEE